MSVLKIWTIYSFNGHYVARLTEASKKGYRMLDSCIIRKDLDVLRSILCDEMGLAKVNRMEEDDPSIIETWL